MALVILMVGALFPSIGGSIGKLHVPDGVANLLGGADYGTITGWMRSEVGAIYGPLVIGASAIAATVAVTAGEEEAGILALVLAQPIRTRTPRARQGGGGRGRRRDRRRGYVGRAASGVAAAGGGIGVSDLTALSLQLGVFGFANGGARARTCHVDRTKGSRRREGLAPSRCSGS